MLSLLSPRWWLITALLMALGAWAQLPAAPAGLQTWVVSPVLEVPDAATKPMGAAETVMLTLPRNGIASCVVVQAATAPFDGALAKMSDLTGPAGVTIPASAVRLRYADLKPAWVPLYDEPVKGRQTQPIWLTVHVPKTAAPGAYTGTLTLGWAAATTVAVKLTVVDWTIADARDWQVWVHTMQSPESVAGIYKVPLWSDQHFALLEQSLKLQGDLGNDIVDVRAVRRTSSGDDPIIVFTRDAKGNLQPEFKFLTRYLDLYEQYCGRPKYMVVNVWNTNMNLRGTGRGSGITSKNEEVKQIGVNELKPDGTIAEIQIPMHDWPGSEEIWQRAMDGLRDLVRARGWSEEQIILGQGHDTWPTPFTVQMFKRIAPYARWVSITHGQGAPKWSYSDVGRTQPNGMVTGIMQMARLLPAGKPLVPGFPVLCNARDNVGDNPGIFRRLNKDVVFDLNHDGVCWKGIDFWGYNGRSAMGTYSEMGNTLGGTPRAITAAGPKGAVATQQLEMWREANAETEAIYAMRAALDKRFPPPTQRCDLTELSLEAGVAGGHGTPPLTLTIAYRPDGTLYVEPQARGYNTGPRTGSGKFTKVGNTTTFSIDIELYKPGMTGHYEIVVALAGTTYTGTYTGKFGGIDRKGAVQGNFLPKCYPVKLGEPTAKTPDQLKGDQVFEDMMAFYTGGWARSAEAGAVAALYTTTAEMVGKAK